MQVFILFVRPFIEESCYMFCCFFCNICRLVCPGLLPSYYCLFHFPFPLHLSMGSLHHWIDWPHLGLGLYLWLCSEILKSISFLVCLSALPHVHLRFYFSWKKVFFRYSLSLSRKFTSISPLSFLLPTPICPMYVSIGLAILHIFAFKSPPIIMSVYFLSLPSLYLQRPFLVCRFHVRFMLIMTYMTPLVAYR